MRQRRYYRHRRLEEGIYKRGHASASCRTRAGQDTRDPTHGSLKSIMGKLKGLGLTDETIKKVMDKADGGDEIRNRIGSNIEIIVFARGAEGAAQIICERTGLVFMTPQLLARALDFPVGKARAIADGKLRSGYDYQNHMLQQGDGEASPQPDEHAVVQAQPDTKHESKREWKARKKEEKTRGLAASLGIDDCLLDKVMECLRRLHNYDPSTVSRNLGALLSSGAGSAEITGLIEKKPSMLMCSKSRIREKCRKLSIKRTSPYLDQKLQESFGVQAKQSSLQEAARICIDEKGAENLLSLLGDLEVFALEYRMKPADFQRFIRENLVPLSKEKPEPLDMLMDEIEKLRQYERSGEGSEQNGKQDVRAIMAANIENAMMFTLSVGFRLKSAKAAVENQYFALEVVHNNTHYRKPDWAEGINERIFEKILDIAWKKLVRAGAIRFHKGGDCAGVKMASQVRDRRVASIVREALHRERNGD